MHWFDIGVGLVMLLGGIRSYFRGLTREVMSTIGLMVIFVLAVCGYQYLPRYIEPVIASPWWRQVTVYCMLLLVAIGAYLLWSRLVERSLLLSHLSIPDRVLGSLFGIIKVGVVIAALLILLMQAMPSRVAAMVQGAKLAPPLLQTAEVMALLLPRDVKNALRHSSNQVLQRSDEQLVQPPDPKSETSQAAPEKGKSPTDISENDERALRQLIKKHSKNQ